MKEIGIFTLGDLERAASELVSITGIDKGTAPVLAFYGNMGAGKTTFIAALCRVLGVNDPVSSPTFSIVNTYYGNNELVINHFDFYRIENQFEAFDMGYEEYFYDDSLCLVEWPEKIGELLPPETVKIFIEPVDGDDALRRISVG